jgi:hypothetical protein
MKNVSEKISRENQNTFYVQNVFYKNRAVYETMWKNMVETDRLHLII